MSRIVFIDANTYLSFYRMSKNDVHEMRKVLHAMGVGEFTLCINDQVVNEYRRNREKVILEAMKKFREERAPKNFPRMVMGYDEFEEVRDLASQLDRLLATLAAKVDSDANDRRLEADELIRLLLGQAKSMDADMEVLDAAKSRFDRGNPPGKSQGKAPSYGDAIHWECLLREAGSDDDLFVVSADSDFASPMRPGSISEFLEREWEETGHEGDIQLFETLGALFKKYYPDLELEVEFEQNRAVQDLLESRNFRSTHDAISRLDVTASFTASQRAQLIEAARENNQVYAIGRDDDVQAFFQGFLDKYQREISRADQSHFAEFFEWGPASGGESSPD